MKVVIFSQFWYPENGVPQRRWSWLAGILRKQGIELSVIAPPPHYKRAEAQKGRKLKFGFPNELELGCNGERIFRSPFLSLGDSLTYRAISQASIAAGALLTAIRRRDEIKSADVVIGTVPALPTAAVAYIVARLFRKPCVIDLRDAWPDLLNEQKRWNVGFAKKSYRQKLFELGPVQVVFPLLYRVLDHILMNSDGIMLTSGDLGQELRKRFGSRVEEDRVPLMLTVRNVFPSAVDPRNRKRKLPAEPKAASLRSERPLHVLYAGTLGRAQNLRNVIDAVALAKQKGTEVELCFVGAGAAKESLIEYAVRKGVTVAFVPQKNANQLRDLYSWADTALVHLTDWEPLARAVPSKTYELMVARIHITGVVEGETARIIREFGVGTVVPPEAPEQLADFWIRASADESLLDTSGEGAEWVRKLREEIIPAELNNYLNVIANRRDTSC